MRVRLRLRPSDVWILRNSGPAPFGPRAVRVLRPSGPAPLPLHFPPSPSPHPSPPNPPFVLELPQHTSYSRVSNVRESFGQFAGGKWTGDFVKHYSPYLFIDPLRTRPRVVSRHRLQHQLW